MKSGELLSSSIVMHHLIQANQKNLRRHLRHLCYAMSVLHNTIQTFPRAGKEEYMQR